MCLHLCCPHSMHLHVGNQRLVVILCVRLVYTNLLGTPLNVCQTFGNNMAQHNGLQYLVAGSLQKKDISMMSLDINNSHWSGSIPTWEQLECRRRPRPFPSMRRIQFRDYASPLSQHLSCCLLCCSQKSNEVVLCCFQSMAILCTDRNIAMITETKSMYVMSPPCNLTMQELYQAFFYLFCMVQRSHMRSRKWSGRWPENKITSIPLYLQFWYSHGVVTYMSPVDVFATSIKMESSDSTFFLRADQAIIRGGSNASSAG